MRESAIGPKRTFVIAPHMSAVGGTADMAGAVQCLLLIQSEPRQDIGGTDRAGGPSAIILASPSAWAAYRTATTPRSGATPPKPRCPAEGKPGRRSYRWQP